MLTIKSELKMLTEKSIYVIHNDLPGYTSPVNKNFILHLLKFLGFVIVKWTTKLVAVAFFLQTVSNWIIIFCDVDHYFNS